MPRSSWISSLGTFFIWVSNTLHKFCYSLIMFPHQAYHCTYRLFFCWTNRRRSGYMWYIETSYPSFCIQKARFSVKANQCQHGEAWKEVPVWQSCLPLKSSSYGQMFLAASFSPRPSECAPAPQKQKRSVFALMRNSHEEKLPMRWYITSAPCKDCAAEFLGL